MFKWLITFKTLLPERNKQKKINKQTKNIETTFLKIVFRFGQKK